MQMAEVSQRRGWPKTGSRALANPRFDGSQRVAFHGISLVFRGTRETGQNQRL